MFSKKPKRDEKIVCLGGNLSKLEKIKSLFTKLAEKWGYGGKSLLNCSFACMQEKEACFCLGAKKKVCIGEEKPI